MTEPASKPERKPVGKRETLRLILAVYATVMPRVLLFGVLLLLLTWLLTQVIF